MRELIKTWKSRAKELERETCALFFSCLDSRTPWYAKGLALCVVAYAVSPIDLIPDFIPVLGYLDDLVLIPLGIVLVMKLVPETVMGDARAHSDQMLSNRGFLGWGAAAVIVMVWAATAALAGICLGALCG